MNKFLKISLYIVSTIILLLAALVGYIYINFEEIKQGALAKLNTYISVPIDVKKIDFTFVSSFPQVSLELDSVYIKSALPTSTSKTMLNCGKVSIGFDFWDIFNQQYKFKNIQISDGEVHLYTDKNGQFNFDILKKDSSATTSGSQNLQLKNVVFDRIHFTYIDQQQQVAAKSFVQHLVFAGDFKETIYDLSMQTAMHIDHIDVNNLHYELNQDFKLQSKLQINKSTKVYKVIQGEVENNQLKCHLSGLIKNEDQPFFDLKLNQEACDLLYLSRFLPEHYQKQIKSYSTKGNLSLTASFKGALSENEKPVLSFKSVLNNGELVSPDKKFVAKKMSFDIEGATQSDQYPDGFVSFSHISTTINQSVLSAELFIENFATPKIKTTLLSNGHLKDFESLIKSSNIKIYSGSYDCQVKLNGLLSDISNNNYENINIEKLMFQAGDVQIDYNKNHLSEINFGTRLEHGDLYIDETKFSYNNQPVKLNVEIQSFLPFLFTGKSPFVKAAVEFDKFEFINEDQGEPDTSSFAIPEFELRLKGNEFIYKKHHLSKINCVALYKHHFFEMNQSSFSVYDGHILMKKLSCNILTREALFEADMEQIDINKMFVGLENFKQNTLTDKNISGILTSKDIRGKMSFNKEWKPIYDAMILETDMTIKDGRLQNFEPIYKLSKFIKLEELKDIKFAELKNKISIHDNQIFIPDMMLANNALSIQLSGTHSFDNDLEYHVKVLLKDLLLKKRKEKLRDEFAEYEEVTDKGMNIYILIKGNIDHLNITYDKKNSRQATKTRMQEEKEKIKQIFKKESRSLNDKKLNPTKSDTVQAPPTIIWDENDN